MSEYPSWTDTDIYHKNHEQLQKFDFPQDQKKMEKKSYLLSASSIDPLLLMTLTPTILLIIYDLMRYEFLIGGNVWFSEI